MKQQAAIITLQAFQKKLQKLAFIWLGIIAVILHSTNSHSQIEPEYTVRDFRNIDQTYIQQAALKIDSLARDAYGTSLKNNHQDISILQRLLDDRHVTKSDATLLQAMGIVLGEVYRSKYPLEWILYTDKEGPSRALQLRHQQHFIFPITSISRRVSVGAAINIETLYQNTIKQLAKSYDR